MKSDKKRGRPKLCPYSYYYTDTLRKCAYNGLCTPDHYKNPEKYEQCRKQKQETKQSLKK